MVCFVYVVAMQHLSRALQANAKSTSVECAAQLDCPTKSSWVAALPRKKRPKIRKKNTKFSLSFSLFSTTHAKTDDALSKGKEKHFVSSFPHLTVYRYFFCFLLFLVKASGFKWREKEIRHTCSIRNNVCSPLLTNTYSRRVACLQKERERDYEEKQWGGLKATGMPSSCQWRNYRSATPKIFKLLLSQRKWD